MGRLGIWTYTVFVGTETNGEANISDMEIYAVSNKWVKISDLTFIDLQGRYPPYTAKSNRQRFKFTFETSASKLRVWLKAQTDNDRRGKLFDKGYIELQNNNGNAMDMQLVNNAKNTMRNAKGEGEYWFDLNAYTYAAKLVAKLETNRTMDSLSGISLGE